MAKKNKELFIGETFLKEYKELCEKHGIFINSYRHNKNDLALMQLDEDEFECTISVLIEGSTRG